MKKVILILFAFCSIQYLEAQVATVTDADHQKALENVLFTADDPMLHTYTNANGEADISAFSKTEMIEIRLMGYKSQKMTYQQLSSQGFKISMKQSGVSLDVFVVSATRWSQPANDVPGRITTIPVREVSLLNPQTAADLLGVSGKVFIQKSQQGGGSPMIRGFATNRLLYTIDGVRMNTAIFRAGNIQNVISLDPLSIENTEVFFGPGSVMYGSDAIGGVMSFQTLSPQFSTSEKPLVTGKALTRYSSANNELTAHLDVGVGWRKFAMITSISSSNFGDLKMGSYGPEEYLRPFYVQRQDSVDVIVTNDNPKIQKPSAYSQINLMQKLRYKPCDKLDIQYGFHYSVTSDYARYDRHIRYKKGLPRYGEWNYGPQEWMMNNLSVTHTGNNTVYDEMSIRLAVQNFEESRIDRDINKDERHIRTENVAAYSGNIDFSKGLGKKHKLLYGLEAVYNDVISTGTDEDIAAGTSAKGPSRYPRSTWASYAAYLSYQFRISEKVMLQAGARYNQYVLEAEFDTTFYPFPYTNASINDGSVSGSLGLVYRPTEKWAINLNLSTGFRSPNVDDLGKVFDSEPGAVVVPNPGLKAEYAWNAEVGLAKVFGEVLKIDLTGYYTYLQNAMVRRDFHLNGLDSILYDGTLSQVQAVQNAAYAQIYGVQAGLEMKLPFGLGLSSDFNYQIGIEELDDGTSSPSRHAPPWFGTSRISYNKDRVNLQLYAIYSGAKKFSELPEEEKGKPEIYAIDENGDPWSPSWYTLNFKAEVKVIEKLFVSAGVENLTDRRYRPYSSGIVAAGRNFVGSLKLVF